MNIRKKSLNKNKKLLKYKKSKLNLNNKCKMQLIMRFNILKKLIPIRNIYHPQQLIL